MGPARRATRCDPDPRDLGERHPSVHRLDAEPLAIVGMAARLPGAANLDAYWELLRDGRSAIGPLPQSRLDRALYFQPGAAISGKTYTELGGTVPDEDFDPSGLGLDADELASADRAHLWFLDTVLAALANAGVDPAALAGRRVGVYVGHARGSTLVSDIGFATSIESMVASLRTLPELAALPAALAGELAERLIRGARERFPRIREDGGPFTQPNAAAGWIARRLRTSGPYMAVDAACASSFAALDLAARAIHAGEIDRAIVGGCSYNQWSSLVLFSQAQALSRTGSFPFDARADGFVSSDGYAAILVERLAEARAAGHPILGVLRGIGGSCDGRGKSLWAPLQAGQVEAIRRAYHDGLSPADVQVVEAHATGTQVGDATEIRALTEAFTALGGTTAAPRPIGSAKSNIGHTRETAGLAALVKMLLAMREGAVPPTANLVNLTPEVAWDEVPFRPLRALEPWPDRDGEPRRAAVDAFGIGGLNYHVVVERPLDTAPRSRAKGRKARASAKTASTAATARVAAASIAPSPVVVLGVGVVLPGAFDVERFAALGDQPMPFAEPDPERWDARLYVNPEGGPYRVRDARAGFVRGWQLDWRAFKIPPKQLEQADPLQFMLLDAVGQALRLAGLEQLTSDDRRRTAVYVGSVFGGDFTGDLNLGLRAPELLRHLEAELAAAGIADGERKALLSLSAARLRERFPIADEAGSFSSSTLASRISKHFDFMGPCAAMDAEEASGLASLAAGLEALRAGECELAVCCGAQRTLHHTRFEQYDRMGRLAGPGGGEFRLAEGAVALLLARADSPLAAERQAYALLGDVSAASSRDGALAALGDAVARAAARDGATPPALVARFGSAASAAAATEERLHARNGGDAPALAISPVDRLGMTQGASGLVALVDSLAVATRREHELARAPGSSGVPIAVHALGLRGLAYHASVEARVEPWRALVARAAPSGVEVVAAAPQGPRLVRLGAESREALATRIRALLADPALAWELAARETRFGERDAWRLAIVASEPEALRTKLASVREAPDSHALASALHEQGVFLHARPAATPGLAFAFSGQGSQYAGMLRGLVDGYPVTRTVLEELDRELARIGEPSFAEIAWSDEGAERLGQDTWRTQISVFAADLLVHRVLASLGVVPSVVFGHSYGEYPALVATGAWSLATGLRATHGRCRALDALGAPRGKLVSTSASPEQIAALVAALSGRGFVAPANYNSPEQTVLAVETALVGQVVTLIEATGEVARVLPVPQPFHSALLADAKPALATVLAESSLAPPRVPLLSGIGNEYVAEPSVIRARLVDQLTEPLRFVEMVRRAYADGARVFVEVGPRTVLTRLIRSILKSEPVAVVCCDHPKVPAVEQLLRVRALLETQDLWPAAHAPSAAAGGAAAGASGVWPYARTRELPAPSVAPIPHFDATQRRRTRVAQAHDANRTHAAPSAARATQAADAPAPAPASGLSEIEALLVKFVCEQTGYPPEVVTLDQDLEADLGIDSIKKARLLGELRDQFRIQMPSGGGGGASLAQFVTLRDIARFLTEKALLPHAAGGATASGTSAAGAATAGAATAAPSSLERELVLAVHGDDRAMGRRHGERFAGAIHATLRRFQELLGVRSANELPLAREALGQQAAYYDEAALDEMRGIAEGAHVSAESIIALNLAMEPQFDAAGCTQLAVTSAANGGGPLLHGANEDSPAGLRLGNEMVRAVLVRDPQGAPRDGEPDRIRAAVLGVAGQVGGINGTNARGLTVSSTMLLDRPRDLSALGRVHPLLVLRILEQASTLDEALAIVEAWPRVGAWSVLLSHRDTDALAYLEYDGPTLAVRRDVDRILTTNHSLLLEGGEAIPEHSRHRFERARALLPEGPITPQQVQALLRDRFDLARGREVRHCTMNTVCRVDNQASFVRACGADVDTFEVTPGPRHGADAERFLHFEPSRWWQDAHATESAAARAGRRMRRWVLRSLPATPEARPRAQLARLATWVVGSDAVASAVAHALGEAGSEVRAVGDPTRVLDESPAPGRLVWVLPCEPSDTWTSPDASERRRRVEQHVLAPFQWVQRWAVALRERDALAGAELVALTRLGGDLGFGTAREIEPAGGAATGLWKALRRELPGLRVKVVDCAGIEPPAVMAQSVVAALSSDDDRVETAWVRGRHQELRMVPRELPALPPPCANAGATPRGAWIVTGGGRGVTAHVARAIAVQLGVHLHLVGSTPLAPVPDEWLALDAAGRRELRPRIVAEARARGEDPERAWDALTRRIDLHQTLAGHRAAGVAYSYHAADVTDAEAVERMLAAVRAGELPVRGILHGAGIEAASDFARKTPAQVRATVESKVLGLQHLLALTAGDEIEHVIGFGSVSGRFGGLGQADYSLASDLLAKLVTAHRRRTGVAGCTFHWPAWDEVGMAVRPESRFALEASGQTFMPVAEGCEHVLRELAAGLPENEVVILDRATLLDLDRTAPAPELDRALDGSVAATRRTAIVDGLVEEQPALRIADVTFDPTRDRFLVDHCFERQPILPAVVGLETLVEAALLDRAPGTAVLVENASIESGLRFRNRAPQRLRVEVVAHGHDRWRASLRGDFISKVGKLGEPDRIYQSAEIGLADAVTRPTDLPPPPADLDWWDMSYPASPEDCEPGRVYHGPALRTLGRVGVSGERAWGELLAPAPTALRPTRPHAEWRVPSAILDGCLVVCGVYARLALSATSLPSGFARLVLLALPDEAEPCLVAARFRERTESHLFFDFQLRTAAGRLVAWAEGYRVEVLDPAGGMP
ncbi:MAG: C45 family autoproteolytic acyltransferase/hydrolase [bacterium]